jgi:hypothetical protein
MKARRSHKSYLALVGCLVLGASLLSVAPASGAVVTVTLSADKSIVDVQKPVTFSGTLSAPDQRLCQGGIEVEITQQTPGSAELRRVARPVTDDSGSFEATVELIASGDFTASVRATPPSDPRGCEAGTSTGVTVLTRVVLDMVPRPPRPRRGSKFELNGSLFPPHPGTVVKLQKRIDGHWKGAGKATLDDAGRRFVKKLRARWDKRVFRALWPKADADHESGKSDRVVVKTIKKRKRR